MRAHPAFVIALLLLGQACSRPDASSARRQYERMLREAGPEAAGDDRVRPLYAGFLDDLLANMPPRYLLDTRDVFAGELPVSEANARTRRTPEGGILILVNRGLARSLYQWARPVAAAVLASADSARSPGSAAIDRFADPLKASLQAYADSGTLPDFSRSFPLNDTLRTLSNLLSLSAMEFVLAHEYAHAVLGHLKGAEGAVPLPESDAFQRELAADSLAVEMYLSEPGVRGWRLPLEVRIAGALFGVMIFEALEEVSPAAGYPQFVLRFGAVKTLVEQNVDLSRHPYAALVGVVVFNLISRMVVARGEYHTLQGDDRRRGEFWAAYSVADTARMLALVARDPEWHLAWARREMLGTRIMLDDFGPSDADRSWSNGVWLGPDDSFTLVVTLAQLYTRVTGKPGLRGLDDLGFALVSSLHDSAERARRAGTPSGAAAARRQIDEIERVIARSTGPALAFRSPFPAAQDPSVRRYDPFLARYFDAYAASDTARQKAIVLADPELAVGLLPVYFRLAGIAADTPDTEGWTFEWSRGVIITWADLAVVPGSIAYWYGEAHDPSLKEEILDRLAQVTQNALLTADRMERGRRWAAALSRYEGVVQIARRTGNPQLEQAAQAKVEAMMAHLRSDQTFEDYELTRMRQRGSWVAYRRRSH